jgi:dipeptidyl-peptidase 4
MIIPGFRKAIVSTVVLCIILHSSSFGQAAKKEFTVAEIYGSKKFAGKSLRTINWMEERGRTTGISYLRTDQKTHLTNVCYQDIRSGTEKILADAATLVLNPGDPPFTISNYILSPDCSKILFTGTLPARRTKTGGDFYLYDLKNRSFRALTESSEEPSNVQFSPDGTKIGFVRSNNIVVMDLGTRKEIRLTGDGADHVFNGRFDWVYEEEFSIIDGWRWSPDGKRIAYWHLDENRVPQYTLWNYGPQHAESIETRYPLPGDPNSVVKIGIVSVETGKTVWVDAGSDTDIFIPRVYWPPDGKSLFVERLNRAQNTLEMLSADPLTGSTKVLFTEKDTAWIEIEDDLTFLPSTRQFIWSSERNGYKHLYLYARDGTLVRQLTDGKWDVESVAGVDELNGRVYFTAATSSPLEKNLCSAGIDGSGIRQLTGETGTHDIDFSADNRFFIDNYSTIVQPTQQRLCNSDGTLIRVLEQNPMNELRDYPMGETKLFSFMTSDSVMLNCSMIKPPDCNPGKKYPVLFHIYGGPGSQTVEDKWGGSIYLWHQMLAQKGYIVVSVDNRGTGFRGKAFKQIVYKNLGAWEVHDNIEAAKYLASLPYVDRERIGIWGWSYGGYVTLLTMCRGAEYFKTGVAVAPVTHWMYYDDIYTERYMGTPKDNPDGYRNSSPITYASLLKGNLLIIHGTGDDNVHFQNTITMVDTLIKANKQFETAFYPGKDHSIRGGVTREHLFTKITEFILKNL